MNADHRHSRALAVEVAERVTEAGITAVVGYDRDAGTHVVKVDHFGEGWTLAMPAPGALFALWHNTVWLGGMNLRADAAPEDVADALIRRIYAAIR